MNRAFLIVIIPAALVGAGYLFVMRILGARVDYLRFAMAAAGFLAAIAAVNAYRRRHPRRPNA